MHIDYKRGGIITTKCSAIQISSINWSKIDSIIF